MTARSSLWLISLPELTSRAVAERLSAASGLEAVRLKSADEAIARLADEVPALVVLNGSLGETERFALYVQVSSAAAGDDIPFVLVDAEEAEARVRLEGSGDKPVGDHATAGSLTDAVWASVTLMTRGSPDTISAAPSASGTIARPAQTPSLPAVAAQPASAATAVVEPPTALNQVLGALSRRWWLALAVLATVMAADVFYTVTRQPTYLARASLIISPSAAVDRENLVYSVDSLGRGRIVGTYAEVLGSELVHREALTRLGYPESAYNTHVVFKSSTVADTAVVQVTAESPDPALSALAANEAGQVGIERMTDLFPVYNLVFLSRAVPPTTIYRPDVIRNYSIGLLIGLVLAVAIAYAVDAASMKMRSTRPARTPKPPRKPGPMAANPAQKAAAPTATKPKTAAKKSTLKKPGFSLPSFGRKKAPAPAAAAVTPAAVQSSTTTKTKVPVTISEPMRVVEAPAPIAAASPAPFVATEVLSPSAASAVALISSESDATSATTATVSAQTEEHTPEPPAEHHLNVALVKGATPAAAEKPAPSGGGLFSVFQRKPNADAVAAEPLAEPAQSNPTPAKNKGTGWNPFGSKGKESTAPAPAPEPSGAAPEPPRESASDRLERILSATQPRGNGEPPNPSEEKATSDRDQRVLV